jgi:hypothetical protein
MKGLPEGFEDAIHSNIDIHLSFLADKELVTLLDRVKVLFGFNFVVHAITYTQNKPGEVNTEVDVRIYLNRKSKMAFVASGGKEDEKV